MLAKHKCACTKEKSYPDPLALPNQFSLCDFSQGKSAKSI